MLPDFGVIYNYCIICLWVVIGLVCLVIYFKGNKRRNK